ncbi:MAG: VWA domain-containing protein [Vicingaceae bacterium]
MVGFRFQEFIEDNKKETPFEKLLKIFLELMTYTSGDFDEAFRWLKELDDEYELTTPEYTLEDFRKDLEKKKYIKQDQNGKPSLSEKGEQLIRKRALEQIFGKLKRGGKGNHRTSHIGQSDESSSDRRPFQFGDKPEQIAFTESFRNAQINHGVDDFRITEQDLEVTESFHSARMSTVLMIDISHSMILYGEDRITPAKKVAMALAELIQTKYSKDSLDIVVFGNDAWEVKLKDLPYLSVGPYHTNTVAGLELAMDLLRRRRNPNRQIFMITDGKPTCIIENGEYYQNSWGQDPKILNRTINLARQCRKLNIPITTFMIAQDPYLQQFVEEFTEANHGKAFYSDLQGLGEFIFTDYEKNKKKRY